MEARRQYGEMIQCIRSSDILEMETIRALYHEILLDNALSHGHPGQYDYAEEFLGNTLALLELGDQQAAAFQLETAILMITRPEKNK